LRLNWFRTPGYPLFIAAVWSFVPTSARYVALLVAQVILSMATCGLLFVIADAVFGRRAALVGAFLYALSPSAIVHGSRAMTETLYVFWIALAVLMAMQLGRSARLPAAIGLGLIWGAAGLTRPEATFLLGPLLLPILMARQRGIPTRFRLLTTAILAKVAVMTPWVVRNYLVYGALVLHVPHGGLNLFAGTYPDPPRLFRQATVTESVPITQTREYRGITEPFWDPEFRARRDGQEPGDSPSVEGMPVPSPDPTILVVRNEPDILEVDRRLAAAAAINIRNHKLLQLYNMVRHLSALWGTPSAWWCIDGLPRPLKLTWLGSYLAFLALFVVGVRVAWKNGKLGVIPLSWLILMAVHTGLLLVLHAEPRFQVTSTIFLYIFGGLGAAAILPVPAPEAPIATRSVAVVSRIS
jgi:4-amino-4-deoxy-L-arabinose transferase-like glycosyltransferase